MLKIAPNVQVGWIRKCNEIVTRINMNPVIIPIDVSMKGHLTVAVCFSFTQYLTFIKKFFYWYSIG